MSNCIQIPKGPHPLLIRDNETGKDVVRLEKNGDFFADWATLRKYYERFEAGEKNFSITLGAAIWLGRNR